MPELPEVETTRRGILPHVQGTSVIAVKVRQRQLRYPVPPQLSRQLVGHPILDVQRRGKYLLLLTPVGTVIIHLGMSGSLRLVQPDEPPGPHDHVDLCLDNNNCLRFRDPRRFGMVLWTRQSAHSHKLLNKLGPEPLAANFVGDYLYQRSRGRRQAIKLFVMDSHCVVGVGNIYASEALFRAGIHPLRAAGRISASRYDGLVSAIKAVLQQAIGEGGTTLRDFYYGDHQPGYFVQSLRVYGRAGQACEDCGTPVRIIRQAQRATYYCPHCQH